MSQIPKMLIKLFLVDMLFLFRSMEFTPKDTNVEVVVNVDTKEDKPQKILFAPKCKG